jgi:hypothetical protein
MKKLLFGLFTILSLMITLHAQSGFKQTIRGRVIDKDSRMPLPGATILLLNSNPPLGSSTDMNGNFRLADVPVGRQGIQVGYVGYKSAIVQNLILNSANETVLEIELEENVIQMKDVTIKASRKDEPNNKMASVSTRTFTVEETEKYAGSRGDVARMAMNYAGVAAANDQRNDIIIRGNSPSGLLWRLEDVDIPNPNHFAENGTTGGPVGMLNNNLLSNSDFFTGAFPAEYGNALSGVFDLKMRNGNNEKHEFLAQSGFNGFEFGAEGPFSKNHQSSYLASARYSTLEVMDGIIDFGTAGVPKYKDLSFKLNFPVKDGKITVFGLAGTSEIAMLDSKKKDKNLYTDDGMDLYNRSTMATTGISLTQSLNTMTYYKVSLSGLYSDGGTAIDTLNANETPYRNINHNYAEYRTSLSGFIHQKYDASLSTKIGMTIDHMGFNLFTEKYYIPEARFRPLIDYSQSLANGVNLIQTFVEGTYKFTDNVSIHPGIHFLYFDLNGTYALEPRLGLTWQFTPGQRISLGYGMHSKIQTLATYYIGARQPDNSLVETNKELDFTRSQQAVVGYDLSISENTRFKTEVYYQYIFNVPVEERATSFSMLNSGAGWGVGAQDSMVNGGTGKNYGVELTLERFFNRGYYFLTTVSLYESKYKGSDGVERNTAFDGNYVLNALFGKEFTLSPRSAITLDYKMTYAGGKRYTPVDMAASQVANETQYVDDEANSKQFTPFLKADIKIGYRINGRKISQEFQFYVENVTDHKNVLMQTYSRTDNEVKDTYQLGIFPMVLWRMHF